MRQNLAKPPTLQPIVKDFNLVAMRMVQRQDNLSTVEDNTQHLISSYVKSFTVPSHVDRLLTTVLRRLPWMSMAWTKGALPAKPNALVDFVTD